MESSRPLDAYSQIVTGVAERLTPKVASLRVPRADQRQGRAGESLGSGVVFTGDGFLLTNAHVVGNSTNGTAEFSDGSRRDVTRTASYDVSDPTQVHVSADGRVEAHAPGETTVSVRFLDRRAISRLAVSRTALTSFPSTRSPCIP